MNLSFNWHIIRASEDLYFKQSKTFGEIVIFLFLAESKVELKSLVPECYLQTGNHYLSFA